MFETTFVGQRVRIIPFENENWVMAKDVLACLRREDGLDVLTEIELRSLQHFTECAVAEHEQFLSPRGAKLIMERAEYRDDFHSWLTSLSLMDDPYSGVRRGSGYERGHSYSEAKRLSTVAKFLADDLVICHQERVLLSDGVAEPLA